MNTKKSIGCNFFVILFFLLLIDVYSTQNICEVECEGLDDFSCTQDCFLRLEQDCLAQCEFKGQNFEDCQKFCEKNNFFVEESDFLFAYEYYFLGKDEFGNRSIYDIREELEKDDSQDEDLDEVILTNDKSFFSGFNFFEGKVFESEKTFFAFSLALFFILFILLTVISVLHFFKVRLKRRKVYEIFLDSSRKKYFNSLKRDFTKEELTNLEKSFLELEEFIKSKKDLPRNELRRLLILNRWDADMIQMMLEKFYK